MLSHGLKKKCANRHVLTCDLQATASAAAANVLRNHAVPPSVLQRIGTDLLESDPQQIVANCVHALCQWRDDTARQADEGTLSLMPS